MANNSNRIAKPSWLRAKLPAGPQYTEVRDIVDQNQLHTVCQSAQCPKLDWYRGDHRPGPTGFVQGRSFEF
mgnify:CR=1 FL=1